MRTIAHAMNTRPLFPPPLPSLQKKWPGDEAKYIAVLTYKLHIYTHCKYYGVLLYTAISIFEWWEIISCSISYSRKLIIWLILIFVISSFDTNQIFFYGFPTVSSNDEPSQKANLLISRLAVLTLQ